MSHPHRERPSRGPHLARWHGRARAVQEEDRLKTGRSHPRSDAPARQLGPTWLVMSCPRGGPRRAHRRTEWLKNVLDQGSATIVASGHTHEVDRPEVIPMAEATAYFRAREQRNAPQFHVDAALQVYRRIEARR